MKIYTGEEVHGFMFSDYKADEPRWVDARELGPVLRLIYDNADLMREPAASLKSIKTIVRQVGVGVMNCPACGVAYVIGARHFSECKLHPGAVALSGAISKDIDDFPGPEDFGLPSSPVSGGSEL